MICSLDIFSGLDFVFTAFFTASCCISLAAIASHVESIFADFFILFQAVAVFLYLAMGTSYALFSNHLILDLSVINDTLLITDIICLLGVAIGDRRLFDKFS